MPDLRPAPTVVLLPLAIALATGLLLGLGGCGHESAPLSPPLDAPSRTVKSADADTVYGYEVRYEGRVYDGQQTTFRYNLAGTGQAVDPTYKFYLELPPCAPDLAAYAPEPADIGDFPDVDLHGIRWTVAIEPDDLVGQAFSITFAGEVAEGVIRTVVRDDAGHGTGLVAGPCGGLATVSGAVFVDADEDGLRDPGGEGGLPNVLVRAFVDGEPVAEALTDGGGAYALALAAGTYTVRVDTAGVDPEAFNDELGRWWAPTAALERTVTVPPDAAAVDFGFRLLTQDVVDDVVEGEIESLGVPVKFWIDEFTSAISMVPPPEGVDRDVLPFLAPIYSPEELVAFLLEVEALALPEPYQFTDGEEIVEALALLSVDAGEPVDLLTRELLATELNVVSGRGLVDDEELLAALIVWGESLVVQARDAMAAGGGLATARLEDLRIAIGVFQTINVGGGGGFDEK